MQKYNIYIDESCHLQNDFSKSTMCIGYIKIPAESYEIHKQEIHKIKLKHKTPVETKWEKISISRMDFYKELIEYFFYSDMQFRCVLVKYKQNLNHDQFNQGSHDNFYYKMIYFLLTNPFFNPAEENEYKVILDIKDTRSKDKLKKIREVFENKNFGNSPFKSFQHIRSHENPLIQLADLFIGAVSYKTRLQFDEIKKTSEAKLKVIEIIEKLSGYTLNESSEPWEGKFNIFDHQPKKRI
jgi:hypothetical protein